MKVTSVHSPHAIQQTTTDTRSAAAAKERAVAKLMGQPVQAQQTPVQNPSQVAPEEISAITPSVPAPQLQKPTSEAPAASEAPLQQQPDAQLQALVRREKALRMQASKQQEAFKVKEAEFARRQAELDARTKELETGYIPKTRFKQDPLGVLAESEVSYDDITQRQLEAQNVNPHVKAHISKLEAQLQAMQVKIDETAKAQESQLEESTQAALRQISRDAAQIVAKDSTGAYEFVKAYGKAGIDAVRDLIKAEFDETNETMSTEEALQLVEQEYEQRFDKFSKLNKVQKRLQAPTVQTPEQKQTLVPNSQPQPMKTLTNAAGSTRQLSARERAILAMEGKLKS